MKGETGLMTKFFPPKQCWILHCIYLCKQINVLLYKITSFTKNESKHSDNLLFNGFIVNSSEGFL